MKNIVVKGARESNLKNITVSIPKEKLVVMTGVSGSGKTALAFNTIYKEGQRRYVESLSSYARQFLGGIDKPNVDSIEGLSPAISIDQKTTSNNPRSTVGTITEIYDYLRLLFARIGHPYCPNHQEPIVAVSPSEITDKIIKEENNQKVIILAPIVVHQKGRHENVFELIQKEGYTRLEVDGKTVDIDEEIVLDKNKFHDIFVIVDRLLIKSEERERIALSVEQALKLGDGKIYIQGSERKVYSDRFCCLKCSFSLPKLEPSLFSFNSPLGACFKCKGIGSLKVLDLNRLVVDPNLSIKKGAIKYLKNIVGTANLEWQRFMVLCEHYNIDIKVPFKDLTENEKSIIINGSPDVISYTITSRNGLSFSRKERIEGIGSLIERRFKETTSNFAREYYDSFLEEEVCRECQGKKLSQEALSVLIEGKNIFDLQRIQIKELYDFFKNLTLSQTETLIGKQIISEIINRLSFLIDVGLPYLSLDRKAETLSGGEAQRIRLASQIGSQLTGVLYVLDEPSIGLHPRDNDRLLSSLKKMRDLGNSLIVVEHDEDIMKQSDWIVDIGPKSGIHGGTLVQEGTYEDFVKNPLGITGKYLSGQESIGLKEPRELDFSRTLKLFNASENNLKNIDVTFPLSSLIVVAGVSGSGKSTLVNEVLVKNLRKRIYHAKEKAGKVERIEGINNIERLIVIDQSPIGRTPRSNPATYTGVFDPIRDLFASTKDSKRRGYDKGRFSFNVKGGRCEKCQGDGVIKIEMHFLPDVYITCEACGGKKYNKDTLEITYKGKTIADCLDMTIEEAYDFFINQPKIRVHLETLMNVGLGYLQLGQNSTTLSGGEAQRVKLASELYKKTSEKVLYVLDEPTTGLHTDDVKKLLEVLESLVESKATVILIEHNLDCIKRADYIIELGPEGGNEGGKVVFSGSVPSLLKAETYTKAYLMKRLNDEKN